MEIKLAIMNYNYGHERSIVHNKWNFWFHVIQKVDVQFTVINRNGKIKHFIGLWQKIDIFNKFS